MAPTCSKLTSQAAAETGAAETGAAEKRDDVPGRLPNDTFAALFHTELTASGFDKCDWNTKHLSKVLRLCLQLGGTECADVLVEHFQLTADDARAVDNYALRWSAGEGHLDVVKYLFEKFHLTANDARADDNYALRWSAVDGHLDTLRCLVEHFHLTAHDARTWDNYALRHSAGKGHLDVVKYLAERFKLTADDARAGNNYALRLSASNGHLETLKFLVEKFQLTAKDARADDNYALRLSAVNGHLDVVKYLVCAGRYTRAEVIKYSPSLSQEQLQIITPLCVKSSDSSSDYENFVSAVIVVCFLFFSGLFITVRVYYHGYILPSNLAHAWHHDHAKFTGPNFFEGNIFYNTDSVCSLLPPLIAEAPVPLPVVRAIYTRCDQDAFQHFFDVLHLYAGAGAAQFKDKITHAQATESLYFIVSKIR